MLSKRTALSVLLVLCAAYVAFVLQTLGMLPERVATHFGASGAPDGWMARGVYGRFIVLFGLGMAAFPQLIGLLMHVLPAWTFNLPNRQYWLAPQRRNATIGRLQVYLAWLGCILLFVISGIHWLTVLANLSPAQHLDTSRTIGLMVIFGVMILSWSVTLMVRFRRPKGA
jgi:uncharacterized membrane protein